MPCNSPLSKCVLLWTSFKFSSHRPVKWPVILSAKLCQQASSIPPLRIFVKPGLYELADFLDLLKGHVGAVEDSVWIHCSASVFCDLADFTMPVHCHYNFSVANLLLCQIRINKKLLAVIEVGKGNAKRLV